MEVLTAQIFNGLAIGSIYVLLVTGFNLLLLVAMIVHFSFPLMVVFSMYVSWAVIQHTGNIFLGILAGILSAVIANAATAPLFQRLAVKGEKVDINATMVVSMGLGMIITDILSHTFNNGFPIAFPDALTGRDKGALVHAGLVNISRAQVLTLAAGVVSVAFLFWLLYRTRTGRAFRAIAEDPAGARLAGIPLLKTGFMSYALTGVLGGITAVLMSVLLGSASAGLGDQLGHKVLAVSIIAGLGNLKGGLVAGLLLGILEALIQGYLAGSWSNAIAFVIMLVVILIKPRGIFGSRL